jgi:hypothetical protein
MCLKIAAGYLRPVNSCRKYNNFPPCGLPMIIEIVRNSTYKNFRLVFKIVSRSPAKARNLRRALDVVARPAEQVEAIPKGGDVSSCTWGLPPEARNDMDGKKHAPLAVWYSIWRGRSGLKSNCRIVAITHLGRLVPKQSGTAGQELSSYRSAHPPNFGLLGYSPKFLMVHEVTNVQSSHSTRGKPASDARG